VLDLMCICGMLAVIYKKEYKMAINFYTAYNYNYCNSHIHTARRFIQPSYIIYKEEYFKL